MRLPSAELARESHYTPRSYLDRWSPTANRQVWAYQLLVPRPDMRAWKPRSTEGIAVRRDLYTSVHDGRESDRIERWLNQEIENPALPVLDRLERRVPLTRYDRRVLARYMAALDSRTPQAYSDHTERASASLESIMNQVVSDLELEIKRAVRTGRPLQLRPPSQPVMKMHSVSVRVRPDPTVDDPEHGVLEISAVVGREMWLDTIERMVNVTSRALEDHDWNVLTPHPGWRWFTSDQPFIRLNYYAPKDDGPSYDFRGGWGREGTDLILPLSPRSLLHACVGKPSTEHVATLDTTVLLHRVIAEHAYRWIVAYSPAKRAEWFRPRVADLQRYLNEENSWKNFHPEQTAAEDERLKWQRDSA